MYFVTGRWAWTLDTPAPAATQWSATPAGPTTATALTFSDAALTAPVEPLASLLPRLAAGDLIRADWEGGSTAWDFTAAGPGVLAVDVWTVPVSAPTGSGPFPEGALCTFGFILPDPPTIQGTTWATLDDARALWPDAVALDDALLGELLAAAYVVCSRFAAPSIGVDPPPPEVVDAGIVGVRRLANVYEARELWAASRRDGDVIGFDSYAVRVRPLSATVQSLLRPAAGRPLTG